MPPASADGGGIKRKSFGPFLGAIVLDSSKQLQTQPVVRQHVFHPIQKGAWLNNHHQTHYIYVDADNQ
ncbi:MAG: hypothetical protein AB2693_35115 [Candidatus Thiodiazotropha sp.]